MKLRPDAPQLWRAMVRAFFPVQLPMYFPFVMVTTAKIVQAQVGVRGLIRVLDTGGEAFEVRKEKRRDETETRMLANRLSPHLLTNALIHNRATCMRV